MYATFKKNAGSNSRAAANQHTTPAKGVNGPAASPIQRITIQGSPTYHPKGNLAGTSELSVQLDGTILGNGANSPSVDPPGRTALNNAGKTGDYRLHLVNGRLGGAGNNVGNLAWGSPKHNRRHHSEFESEMQSDAEDNQLNGMIMDISVEANYHSPDQNIPWKKYFLKSLDCNYKIMNGNKVIKEVEKTISEQFTQDIDDQAYNNQDDFNNYLQKFLPDEEVDHNAIDDDEILDHFQNNQVFEKRTRSQNRGGAIRTYDQKKSRNSKWPWEM
jgi:hypothetical protein